MNAHGVIVRANGRCVVMLFTSLEDLQRGVGGYIESVSGMREDCTVYANEEGLLLRLPYNSVASRFTGLDLVGDVIVLGPVDDEGDETDLTPDVLAEIFGLIDQNTP